MLSDAHAIKAAQIHTASVVRPSVHKLGDDFVGDQGTSTSTCKILHAKKRQNVLVRQNTGVFTNSVCVTETGGTAKGPCSSFTLKVMNKLPNVGHFCFFFVLLVSPSHQNLRCNFLPLCVRHRPKAQCAWQSKTFLRNKDLSSRCNHTGAFVQTTCPSSVNHQEVTPVRLPRGRL